MKTLINLLAALGNKPRNYCFHCSLSAQKPNGVAPTVSSEPPQYLQSPVMVAPKSVNKALRDTVGAQARKS